MWRVGKKARDPSSAPLAGSYTLRRRRRKGWSLSRLTRVRITCPVRSPRSWLKNPRRAPGSRGTGGLSFDIRSTWNAVGPSEDGPWEDTVGWRLRGEIRRRLPWRTAAGESRPQSTGARAPPADGLTPEGRHTLPRDVAGCGR